MIGAVVPLPEAALSTKPSNGVPSVSISARIWGLADKLVICAHSKSFDADSFCNLCISLSREIDNATATNEVPDRVSELPSIFKLVCQRGNVCSLQAAIMALMVTVKNACKALWFTSNECQELLHLANEVVNIFCTPEGFSCDEANIISIVLKIMSRYYPLLKLGHILASVAIKPGFVACAVDFHLSKKISCSATERVRLLVAMKDNVDAFCIINPPKVNILLNGVGLQGRIVGCMSLGPQLPTIVNHILSYGTNLLQAIGHFDAHYIVLVAVMSAIQTSDLPAPHDYVQPPAAAVDSDAEVIVGPSKISLNCPISFSRITKPVKGYLCNHLQCFDLSNYIEINSKRPSWRCPLCNQPLCYPDIRIDQKMLKILQEVGEGVTNVIFHSDGSWEATSGGDDHNESHTKAFEGLQPMQLEAHGLLTGSSNVCDLTEVDGEMICLDVNAPQDRKAVVQPDLQSKPMNPSVPSIAVAGEPSQVNQNSTQVQGISHSGPSRNHSVPSDYNTSQNPEAGFVIPAPITEHFTPSAVSTDSVSLAANREQLALLGTNQQSSSLTPIHPPSTYNLWLQQLQYGQMMSSERGGCYEIPGNAATQAPVQMPSPRPFLYSSSPFMGSIPQNTPPCLIYPSLSLPTVSTIPGTAQRGSIQQTYISQFQLQQSSTAQMGGLTALVHQVPGNVYRAPVQTPGNGYGAPVQAPGNAHGASVQAPGNAYRVSVQAPGNAYGAPVQAPGNAFRAPVEFPGNAFGANPGLQVPHQPQLANCTPPQMVYMPPHLRARTQVQSGGPVSNIIQTTAGQCHPYMAYAPQPTRPSQMQASRPLPASIPMPAPAPVNVLAEPGPSPGSGGTVRVSRTEDLLDVQSEQNWQSTMRMRGSLSGQAYKAALDQFVIRPTQTTHALTGQPSNQSNMSHQLQMLLANRNPQSSQPNLSQNKN